MSLQERLETIRSSPAPQNEESAKLKILTPILQNLGWDPFGPEVLYEYRVGSKGGAGRVDIALRSAGRVVALIEAKAPGSDLHGHVTQVLEYAFVGEGDICVLTTGLEWWLYLPRESGPPPERRFAVLRIADDPVEQLLEDFNAFLSKETLVDGQAKTRAKAVLKAIHEEAQLNKGIPSIWTRMLNQPDEDLVELVSRRVYEQVNLRPTRPQVVAALQGSRIPPSGIPTDPPEAPPTPPGEEPPGIRKKPRPSVKPTTMILWGKRYEVTTSRAVLLQVVDALHERHRDDFHRILEVKGKKFPFAARDPEMLKAEYREVRSSGVFIDVHCSAPQAIARARRFLKFFGHNASDLEVFYD